MMKSLWEYAFEIEQLREEKGKRKRKAADMENNVDIKIKDEDLQPEIRALKRGKDDDFFERVIQFALKPMKKSRKNHFPDVPVLNYFGENKNDWTDKELKNLEIFKLEKLSVSETVSLGRKTFKAIHTGVTKKAVASLMVLAYNLIDDKGSRLIDEYESELVDSSKMVDVSELHNYKLTTGNNKPMETNVSDLRRAIGYTYLAASYLRLFTKSAENYSRIGDFLKEKFRNFYTFEFPFDEFHPELEIIKKIKKCFEINPLFKNTLYVILYASCKNPKGENLKEFLYKVHLNYTGPHAYVLFLKCMESLDINCEDLANLLNIPMFKHQLQGIRDLMLIDQMKGDYALKMWKFARIFDSKFMSPLRTKHCVMFTLVLAFILSETGGNNKEGSLQIAQLKDASDFDRKQAYKIAKETIIKAKRIVMQKKEHAGEEDHR